MKVIKREFPSWAPKQVIAEWEDEIEKSKSWHRKFPSLEPDTEEADLIERLLTYSDMRSVWARLPKYEIEPMHFISMVQLASYYVEMKPHNLTPKEYEKWKKEVKETALKLKNLVEFSNYDRIFQESYVTRRQKAVVHSIAAHSFKLLSP